MTQADHIRDMAVEAAIYVVSTAGTASDARTRLRHAIDSLLPMLRLTAAQEYAAEIRSFVNPARIDIDVSVVTRSGEVFSTREAT
ncbi:hypothetical protein [uncultured Roseovarius sp.]|uniref:hypothetical protein n=1 Tax=uncultured Roseovarius sp. TaxID=293344 RepID=UPI00261DF805|nr:hypothetical protein [uncultured Roseovarius sp.]